MTLLRRIHQGKLLKLVIMKISLGLKSPPQKLLEWTVQLTVASIFYSGDATTTAHGDAASKSESSSSESESSEHESEEESPAQSQSQSQSQSTTLTPGFDNALKLALEQI